MTQQITLPREVVEQLLGTLEFMWRDVSMNEYAFAKLEEALTAGRAALAQQGEDASERAKVIAKLRSVAANSYADAERLFTKAADMLAADAQPAQEPIERSVEYKQGWSDCMTVFADHMTRMNAAIKEQA